MNFNNCIKLCNHYQNPNLKHPMALKMSTSPFAVALLSLPQPLAVINLVFILVLLAFLKHHIHGIIWYINFCVWLNAFDISILLNISVFIAFHC